MPAHPCSSGCECGLHSQTRSQQHKARIGNSVKLTQEANRRLGKAINQWPVKTR